MCQKITSNNKSTFGKHLRDLGHVLNLITYVELLHHIGYGLKQDAWVELDIFKHTKNGREELIDRR